MEGPNTIKARIDTASCKQLRRDFLELGLSLNQAAVKYNCFKYKRANPDEVYW